MEISWNSNVLQWLFTVFGWTTFFVWSCSLFPQALLNFRRKSVVGFNFNYVLMNNTKHTAYLIYNVCLYFSPTVQLQYHRMYGFDQMIPVAANDVALSTVSTITTVAYLIQIAIYERGDQKFSKLVILLVFSIWVGVAVCFFIALPDQSWLWLLSILSAIQVCLTTIKYTPQAVMNFIRKSTGGFSIDNVLLDFTGGTLNYSQMVVQSIDQRSWINLYGNIGKVMISLVSMFFDLIFMLQHYILYADDTPSSSKLGEDEIKEPLLCPEFYEEIKQQSPASPKKPSPENV